MQRREEMLKEDRWMRGRRGRNEERQRERKEEL
jgi:hypothetical protein